MVIRVRADLYSSDLSYQNVANNQEDPVTITIQSKGVVEEKDKMVKLRWSSNTEEPPAKKVCTRPAKLDEETLVERLEPKRKLRKEGRRFSNDLEEAVRSKCNICEKRFLLSELRAHTKSEHLLSFSDYKKFYGLELEENVYHRCSICSATMLLDIDTLTTHIKKHNISLSNYRRRYLSKSAKRTKTVPEKVTRKEVIWTTKEIMEMNYEQIQEALDLLIKMYS